MDKSDFFQDALDGLGAIDALAVLISNPDASNEVKLDESQVVGLSLILRLISKHCFNALMGIDPNMGVRITLGDTEND